MSWVLPFFRHVGDPELVLEETDPLFDRLPRFHREPESGVDETGTVHYRYANPINGCEFEFEFVADLEEAEAGEDDELEARSTGLSLRLPTLEAVPSPGETAQEAIPVAVEVCQALSLLVLDPDTGAAAPPRERELIQTYLVAVGEIEDVLGHARRRARRALATGCVFLAAALLLALLMLLGVGRR